MAPGFGTSGVRGLVTELTDRECSLYARAFVRHLRDGNSPVSAISLAGDFRSSTPRILRAAAWGLQAERVVVDFCGAVPTPALAAHAFARGQGSIMVTGSHIPDDRNGMKFYLPAGEVLKSDEANIAHHRAALEAEAATDDSLAGVFGADGMFWLEAAPELPAPNRDAESAYRRRYLDFFPRQCLAGRRIVLYEHSSVARDILGRLLEGLGASVIRVGRSAAFIPVDTEAVENPGQLADWVRTHRAEALLSADGDGDRPLLVDDQGAIVRGDVLGILVAGYLRADFVAAPVSCNTAIEKCGQFGRVQRTRIGSPFVVEAMQAGLRAGARRVVGFEANGGFMLGSDIARPAGAAGLRALPTRDAALPLLGVLHAAAQRALSLSQLVRTLPARATFSGLLRPLPTDRGQALVRRFHEDPAVAAGAFSAAFGAVESVDFTDGARITFANGEIVHLRPSGNAPEFRVYSEAASAARAAAINATAMDVVRQLVGAASAGGN